MDTIVINKIDYVADSAIIQESYRKMYKRHKMERAAYGLEHVLLKLNVTKLYASYSIRNRYCKS